MWLISSNILILLMLLQATLLQQITTRNLVKVTVSQTQLESNFEAILHALKSHDSSISDLMAKVGSLESSANAAQAKSESHSDHQQLLQRLVKESTAREIEQKRLTADLREVWDKVNGLESQNKEINQKLNKNQSNAEIQHGLLEKIEEQVKKSEERINCIEDEVRNHDIFGERIEGLQKQLKEQTAKIAKMQQLMKDMESRLNSKGKEQSQGMSEDGINKLLRELENKLTGKLSEHEGSTKAEIEKLQVAIHDIAKSHLPKVADTLDEHSRNAKKLSEDIWRLNDQLYKTQGTADPLDQRRVAELERKVEDLRDKLSSLLGDNTLGKNYSTALKTPMKSEPEWSPPSNRHTLTDRQEFKDLNQIKEQSFMEQKVNFKKQIIDKLKQQKGDFNKALKKLDTMNLKEQREKISAFEEKLLRLQHILEGKVDEEGLKKWMRFIENKLNYLYRIVNVDSPEEDACIARKNWICLSCDKKLDAYKGKVGTHLISANLKPKTIDQDVVGGGMLFRSKSRYEMPTVKK